MNPLFQRILVPVDFSEASPRVFSQAAVLAREFGARIDLLHVWEPPVTFNVATQLASGSDTVTLEDFMLAHATREMTRFVDAMRPEGLALEPRVVSGDPAETIIRLAGELKSDLVVMGTRGRGALARMLLGSVATKVVAAAPCPVLTLRVQGGEV